MRTSTVIQVRSLLRENPDGLTIQEINARLDRTPSNMRRVLRRMPDVYIDRWEPRPRRMTAAVWCAVVPPEDCPRPEMSRRKND